MYVVGWYNIHDVYKLRIHVHRLHTIHLIDGIANTCVILHMGSVLMYIIMYAC